MKIKLDENLPGRLVQALTDLGHDVDTVILERVGGELLLSPQSVEIIKFGDPGSGR